VIDDKTQTVEGEDITNTYTESAKKLAKEFMYLYNRGLAKIKVDDSSK